MSIEGSLWISTAPPPTVCTRSPRQAARLAIETAEALDRRLEAYPPDLLELIHAEYKRYVFRAYHRTEHLNEAEAALRSDSSPADNPQAARARTSE